jgi:hypothetical protein
MVAAVKEYLGRVSSTIRIEVIGQLDQNDEVEQRVLDIRIV